MRLSVTRRGSLSLIAKTVGCSILAAAFAPKTVWASPDGDTSDLPNPYNVAPSSDRDLVTAWGSASNGIELGLALKSGRVGEKSLILITAIRNVSDRQIVLWVNSEFGMTVMTVFSATGAGNSEISTAVHDTLNTYSMRKSSSTLVLNPDDSFAVEDNIADYFSWPATGTVNITARLTVYLAADVAAPRPPNVRAKSFADLTSNRLRLR